MGYRSTRVAACNEAGMSSRLGEPSPPSTPIMISKLALVRCRASEARQSLRLRSRRNVGMSTLTSMTGYRRRCVEAGNLCGIRAVVADLML